MTAVPAPVPRPRLRPEWAARIRAEVDRAEREHPFTPEKVAQLRMILHPTIPAR